MAEAVVCARASVLLAISINFPWKDGRKGSAQVPSSLCSGEVWVKNNICKHVPCGAFLSVWLLCLVAFRICAEACLPGSRVDTC